LRILYLFYSTLFSRLIESLYWLALNMACSVCLAGNILSENSIICSQNLLFCLYYIFITLIFYDFTISIIDFIFYFFNNFYNIIIFNQFFDIIII
jgi:hypothetical protein